MMHRFLCPRINDASIISPPHQRCIDYQIRNQWCIDYLNQYQRCIDYLPPASLMHRLFPPRIIDASIIAIIFDASMHRLISIIDADPYPHVVEISLFTCSRYKWSCSVYFFPRLLLRIYMSWIPCRWRNLRDGDVGGTFLPFFTCSR